MVCPTTALRAQWADAADRVGIHLDPRWRNADGVWPPAVDGIVVTYQQVASAPDLFAHHLARPTFVVLDEVHHAGESATWGAALRAAFETAQHRLALSGTPFRSDARAIPFVTYDAERRCAPDFVYGYADAVAEGVCRPLAFRLLDATLRWRVDAQETIAAFADDLEPVDDARRLRTAIDPTTALPAQMLRDADALLLKARAVVPDAAGLLLCDDRAHARASAALLRTIAGEKPVVVVSDEAGAHARIERFARGDAAAPRWLVAVNMVSEGVDVPRLVIAAYLTVKRTDLFFRQAVGRVVRRRPDDPDDLVATVFLPADPTLKACAERVEVELRQQVCEDIDGAYEVEPPAGVAMRRDFQALDAQVQPGGMIVAGIHYRGLRSRRPAVCCASWASPSARCDRCWSSCVASARVQRSPGKRPSTRRRRPPSRPLPPTAEWRPSGSHSIAWPAAGPSCVARSTRTTAGLRRRPASTGRWVSPGAARPPSRSSTTAWPSCAVSWPSSPTSTPTTRSGCASRPASRRSTGASTRSRPGDSGWRAAGSGGSVGSRCATVVSMLVARDLLLLARRTTGLSQAELARRLGKPRSTVARWELGETEPGYNAVMGAIRACDMAAVVQLARADESYLGDVGERLRAEPIDRLRALRGEGRVATVARIAELRGDAIVIGDTGAAMHGWPLLLPAGEPVEVCASADAEREVLRIDGVTVLARPPGTSGYMDLRRDRELVPTLEGVVAIASPLDLLRIELARGHHEQAGAIEAVLEHRRRWPEGPPSRREYGEQEAREAVEAWLSRQP